MKTLSSQPRSWRHSKGTGPAGEPPPAAGPGPRWLYAGLALFAALAVLTFASIRREEERRIGQSRADTLFELVQDQMPDRPTATPGVAAWLHLELTKYRRRLADPERARLYGEIAGGPGDGAVPPFLAELRDVLAEPPSSPPPGPLPRFLTPPGEAPSPAGAPLQFRVQRYLELGGQWFVVTRRRELDVGAPDPFLAGAAAHLLALGETLSARLARHPLPAVPGPTPARVLRLYAVAPDGTLLSLPLAAPGAAGGGGMEALAAQHRAALEEGREFRKLPELPHFLPEEFAFRFDFTAPRGQSYFSGLYLDLGGQGLVATVLVPAVAPAAWRGVVATDLQFDLDWNDFAAGIEPPLTAQAVHLSGPPGERWFPWRELARGVRPDGHRELAAAVAQLAEREGREGRPASPFYLYHGKVEGKGAVAALQVAARTWLVILFPASRPSFAWLPALLLGLLAILLIAGFEVSRRRTVRAQQSAEREFAEKQSLLNTMQVPLIVVDPNSDEVVFGNRAAESLGLVPGTFVGERVADLPGARAHYERMQVAGHGVRRAYGVPMRVEREEGGEEVRFAVVRSVAVTAPIPALAADQRHRLGILFLLEPEADLTLLTGGLVAEARAEERSLLAGLLSHGVDTLARVLAHLLAAGGEAALSLWLAAYLERRVVATAWLLEHWDARPPLPPDSTLEPRQVRETLARFAAVFAGVREDAELRSRLHWDNGALAALPADGGAALELAVDWPEEHWFTCPVRGGFGFFLGELLTNAVRHGRPGTRPRVAIVLDRVRRELVFTVENSRRPDWRAPAERGEAGEAGKRYGGLALLERLAHLFEWRELTITRMPETFSVSFRIPVSERGEPGLGD